MKKFYEKIWLTLFLLLIPVRLFAAEISTVVVVSIDALHPSALTQKCLTQPVADYAGRPVYP